MMNWVKPNLLGTKQEYNNRFVNPIVNGEKKDSTDDDVKLMKFRAHVLHRMLQDCVQRYDYSILPKMLPPKYEFVIQVNLSPLQKILYMYYIEFEIG